jgi:FkbM family methyltransferase
MSNIEQQLCKVISSKLIYSSELYKQDIILYPDYIHSFINNNKLWDYDVCNEIVSRIKPNSELIDIGANYGLISLGVNRLLSEKKIKSSVLKYHLFECNNDLYDCLDFNTKTLPRIIYPLGLSDCIGTGNLQINTYNQGCNYIINTFDSSSVLMNITENPYNVDTNITRNDVMIPLFTLDNFIHQFNNVSVIKIDVEGMEYNVLKGSLNVIRKFKPTLIIEIWNEHKNNVIQLLKTEGYSIKKILFNEICNTYDYVFTN